MRAIGLLLALAALAGGGAWWWVNRDPVADRAEQQAELARETARLGLRRMLRETDQFQFDDIVVGGRRDDGDWDFRAMLTRGGSSRAAYGRARPSCASGLESPNCWQLAYLESEGESIEVIPADPSDPAEAEATVAAIVAPDEAAAPDPAQERDPAEAALEADLETVAQADPEQNTDPATDQQTEVAAAPPATEAEVEPAAEDNSVAETEAEPAPRVSVRVAPPPPRPTVVPGTDQSPAAVAREGASTRTETDTSRWLAAPSTGPGGENEISVIASYDPNGPLPPATHNVALPLINARSGPSTSEEVITTLPSGTQLSILEVRAGWGRFVILSGDREGSVGWAAMSLLQEVPQ